MGGLVNPKRVTKLANGSTLVVETCRRRLLESDRSGGLVAALPIESGYAVGACSLEGGETIVGLLALFRPR